MQAELIIECSGCNKKLGVVKMDTADMPDKLQERINKVILAHRQDCRCYKS